VITVLVLRSIIAGAYLVALVVNGRFDLLTVVIAGALVVIWAIPQFRRHRLSTGRPGTRGASTPHLGA
jgi:hypothetical protein